ncbi:MAG: hypothetical protein LBV52_00845 [Spirochaetaceae bacterium]|jgi:uncharacterized coiled-coil protein SlyX|nr:hypothetical protein [Spirochaetaceae bacterium]
MEGKVFAESSNLHQDKARILFDYYKKAAEKIVKEETELEASIGAAKLAVVQAGKDKKKGIIITVLFLVLSIIIGIASGGVGFVLIVGAVWGISTILKAKKTKIESETKIQGFEEAFRDIRRDYNVKKLGVVYVPIATKVPFEDKSFVVDHTGLVGNIDFNMSVVHKPQELLASLSSLDGSIQEAPIVESSSCAEDLDTSDYSTSMQNIKLYDYMGNIDRQIRNIRYLLNDNDTVSLSLPVVLPKTESADFIKEYTSSDTKDKAVLPVFNIDGFKEKIDTFYSLNDMRKSFEKSTSENQIAYFKKLIGRLAESVQILSRTKMNGSAKLVDYSNKIFSTVLKASFNQYSPALEAEEIERIRTASFDYQDSVDDYTPFSLKSSSRVKYDLFSTAWIAEDQTRTSMPFGMHQIQEEVLAPVIQNLMAENRIERLKIYNGIKDQKIDYLNQWHRDTEDFYGRNRAEAADLINRMRESYSDYVRALNTYKALVETQNTMAKTRSLESTEVHQQDKDAEIIAGFETQAAAFNRKQEEFSDFMDRLKENIDEKASQFGYIPYYEATLRDNEYRDIARSTDQLQDIDPRRKKLLAISPYIARFAALPPEPSVEQLMYDDFSIDLLREAAIIETETEKQTESQIEDQTKNQTEDQTNAAGQEIVNEDRSLDESPKDADIPEEE